VIVKSEMVGRINKLKTLCLKCGKINVCGYYASNKGIQMAVEACPAFIKKKGVSNG